MTISNRTKYLLDNLFSGTLPGILGISNVSPGELTLGTWIAQLQDALASTASRLIFGKETSALIKVAATTSTDTNGADLSIQAGAKNGSACDGVLRLGDCHTSKVDLGECGRTIYAKGSLRVCETSTLVGDVHLGSECHPVDFCGQLAGDVVMTKEQAHRLYPAASTCSNTDGAAVSIDAAQHSGEACDGHLSLGTCHTGRVNIGMTCRTTDVKGNLQVCENATINGDVQLGADACKNVSVNGVINTDLIFHKECDRHIYPAQSTCTNANGASIYMDAGNADGSGTDGTLSLGTCHTNAVILGHTCRMTVVQGNLEVCENVHVSGAVTGNLAFHRECDHKIEVAATTTTDGNGGGLELNGGLHDGVGVDGEVWLGRCHTSAVRVGADCHKIGLYGVDPVVQPHCTGESDGFTVGSGTPMLADSTFTGGIGDKAYNISDIVKALKQLGALKASC